MSLEQSLLGTSRVVSVVAADVGSTVFPSQRLHLRVSLALRGDDTATKLYPQLAALTGAPNAAIGWANAVSDLSVVPYVLHEDSACWPVLRYTAQEAPSDVRTVTADSSALGDTDSPLEAVLLTQSLYEARPAAPPEQLVPTVTVSGKDAATASFAVSVQLPLLPDVAAAPGEPVPVALALSLAGKPPEGVAEGLPFRSGRPPIGTVFIPLRLERLVGVSATAQRLDGDEGRYVVSVACAAGPNHGLKITDVAVEESFQFFERGSTAVRGSDSTGLVTQGPACADVACCDFLQGKCNAAEHACRSGLHVDHGQPCHRHGDCALHHRALTTAPWRTREIRVRPPGAVTLRPMEAHTYAFVAERPRPRPGAGAGPPVDGAGCWVGTVRVTYGCDLLAATLTASVPAAIPA